MIKADKPAASSRDKSWQQVFEDGYVAVHTTDPQRPEVSEFYAAYDDAFVLESEKEDLEGFRVCLSLNNGAVGRDLTTAYGPFREIITLLRNPEGMLVGAANYFVLAQTGAITINLNYVFVQRAHRGGGLLKRLLAVVSETGGKLFEASAVRPVLIFVEQNDPLRMDPDDYARDTKQSGLDQMDRLRIWHRLGVRLVDINYQQPALSTSQTPDEGLLYGVIAGPATTLDACLLHDHLRGFFSVSVLKGRSVDEDAVASAQLARLAEACARGETVKLIDHGPALFPGLGRNEGQGYASFRAYVQETLSGM